MRTDGLAERLAGRLARGRAAAESLMTLTLTAYAPDGVTQDEDGYDVPLLLDLGTARGKVQGTSNDDTATRYVTVAGTERPVLSGGLHIPVSAFVTDLGLAIVASEQLTHGWQFEVTDVGTADPALLSNRYLVVGVPAKSYATARRLDVVKL